MIFFRRVGSQDSPSHAPKPDSGSANGCATSGASSRGNAPTALSEQAREIAIRRAASLVEVFVSERELFEALYARDGCFSHKGSADAALANAQKARELMEALIRGRSAATIARMERARGLDLPACANEGRGTC